MWLHGSNFPLQVIHLDIRSDYSWWCQYLLDEAKAVDDFVQVEVGVLPRLHDGLFTLESRRDEKKNMITETYVHFGIRSVDGIWNKDWTTSSDCPHIYFLTVLGRLIKH